MFPIFRHCSGAQAADVTYYRAAPGDQRGGGQSMVALLGDFTGENHAMLLAVGISW